MNGKEVKNYISRLALPAGQYVVFGGVTMALSGIRNAVDLDLFITGSLYRKLKNDGWKEKYIGNRRPYLVNTFDGFDIHAFQVWEGGQWKPRIDRYFSHPEFIEGVPCMPLEELYEWKNATRRPKDLQDLSLISEYWNTK